MSATVAATVPMYELYDAPTKRVADKAKRAAEALGGQWFHFCQDVYLRGRQLGANGVCYALSYVFMARIKSGAGGFTSYVFSAAGRNEVMDLWTMQKQSVGGWEKMFLAGVGLKERYQRRNDTVQQMQMLVTIPGYYGVGLTNWYSDETHALPEKLSGHAVAVINDSDKHYTFDPNLGAGLFTSADAAASMLVRICNNVYKEYAKGETLLSRYS
ncbi:MAG: hypothetical protein ABSC95_16915 [Acetobacteraceae bacterium]|jgi:hypothetical protein